MEYITKGIMSPFKPLHPCNYQNCPNLTAERFCKMHKKKVEKDYEKNRGSSSERGYDARWHRTSALHLKEFPLCAKCGKAATLTHHIIPIAAGGAIYDWDNLASSCGICHDGKHKEDRWRKKC